MKNIESSTEAVCQKRFIAEAKYNTIENIVITFLMCTTIIIVTLYKKQYVKNN